MVAQVAERTEVRGKEMGPVAVVAELYTVTDTRAPGSFASRVCSSRQISRA